jgi:PAS domain S-box-containing protein
MDDFLAGFKLEDFLSITHDGVIALDEQQRIVLFNAAAEQIFGYRAVEIMSHRIDLLVPHRYRQAHRDLIQEFSMGLETTRLHQQRQEVVGLRKDGTEFPAEASITRFEHAGRRYYAVFVRDISHRKQAQQSQRKWALAFENAELGIVIDHHGAVSLELLNPAFARLYGYTIEELQGKPIQNLFLPEDRPGLPELLKQIDEQEHITFEFPQLRKDGSTFDALIDITNIKESAGTVQYRVVNVRDISERKRFEEELSRRDAILQAVTFAAESYLQKGTDWEDSIQDVLEKLGRAAGISRVYLFEQHVGEDDVVLVSQRYEWTAPGITPQIKNPDLQNFSFSQQGFKRWEEEFKQGNPIFGVVKDFPQTEQMLLAHQSILSIAAVPVFTGGQLWGFIGFDDCVVERTWSMAEIGALKTAASILGEAMQHSKMASALRSSEKQYRQLVENLHEGICSLDVHGVVTFVNPHMTDMLGYQAAEMLGKPFAFFMDPHEKFLAPLDPEHHQKTTGPFEYICLHKNGTPLVVEMNSSPLHDSDGKFLGVILDIQDVTERKLAEAALQESRERFASIVAAIDEGIIFLDADGVIRTCNASAERILGFPGEKMIGRSLISIDWGAIHEDGTPYQGHTLPAIVTLRSGQPCSNVTMGLLIPDGKQIWITLNTQPMYRPTDPHPYGVVASFTDITEKRRAEAALVEREQQYYSIFESTQDGLFINRFDGTLVDFNPAAATMHGYTPEEFRKLQPPQFVHPDSFHVFETYLATVKTGGQFRGQAIDICKDGSLINVEVIGAVFNYQGELHTLAMVRDITEVVQAYQLLEQRVDSRTRELSALLEVSRTVSSNLELAPLLKLILEQLKNVVDYTGAGIAVRQGEDYQIKDYLGPAQGKNLVNQVIPHTKAGAYKEIEKRRAPVIIDDIWGDDPWPKKLQKQSRDLMDTYVQYARSWMGIPLIAKDKMVGILRLDYAEPGFFTPAHARLALAFAELAAIAIENASLYQQAQSLAALEERQKLARELHDSVSQAIYGIALGVRTARALVERDPAKAIEPLDYCLNLADAGLAEMRALIFELRPESLEQEGVVAALQKHADSLQVRHGLVVKTVLCAEPAISVQMKEAIYRIAQEALQNVIKHARATRAELRLGYVDKTLNLEISDNGQGFDTSASFPGHLGLRSMRERAEKLGAKFWLESHLDHGTCVHIQFPADQGQPAGQEQAG